jgi:hypothetical protein
MLREQSRLWYREDMKIVVEACAIMHNQIVIARRNSYNGTRKARIRLEQFEAAYSEEAISYTQHRMPVEEYERMQWLDEHVSPVESVQQHKGFKEALTEFMWVMKGSAAVV